jgi:NAD(P)-dependent dehydrogenase (short-subunit alcohol dehydrogenase family)
MFDLTHKTVVVAGGGRGIGRAASLRCASYGATVAVLDIDQQAAQGTVDDILAGNGKASALRCDITSRANVREVIDHIAKRCDRIDVLFNSVGLTRLGTIDEISDEDFDFVLDVNLKGAFVISSEIVKRMKATGGGRIIHCASYCGVKEEYANAAYCAAKAGLIMLTRVMALEMGEHNISAVAISPGNIETELLDQAFRRRAEMENVDVSEIYERAAKRVPLRRLGTVDDIANLVAFLSSDASFYINGENIMMTGGYVMN